ncbi:MAG: T9SS type A sorting domain-containing protein, partial [Bacteroidota bacterium]
EKNNSGFEVERSSDGRTFGKIGFIKGTGSTTDYNEYSYTDADAFKATGIHQLYYRLKQVDLNGDFTYSNTVLLCINNNVIASMQVTAYPIPFKDAFTIRIVSPVAEMADIEISNAQGSLVSSRAVSLAEGENILKAQNLIEQEPGIYFIKVVTATASEVIKVMKENR